MTVLTSLLYKEWIKVRHFCWIPSLLALAAVFQGFLSFNGFRTQHGASLQYMDMIDKQTVVFGSILPAFVLGGVAYALMQCIPDCLGRRARLMFHLPVSTRYALYVMLGAGLLGCLASFVVALVSFALTLEYFGFPRELAIPMLLTLVPWGLAMCAAYFATSAVLFEPFFPRKLAYAVAGALSVCVIAPSTGYGLGNDLMIRCLVPLLWIPAVEAAALRIKEGK